MTWKYQFHLTSYSTSFSLSFFRDDSFFRGDQEEDCDYDDVDDMDDGYRDERNMHPYHGTFQGPRKKNGDT